ncbi:MAG: 2-hydroxyacid dehydrogenase [Paludibacter sp.]|jgi:D-lactate dehydrogenase|nr:2-hydroxyacid dehydrogenase [Paludibacter sp.]MBP6356579.1 2-hydroxyacid dehydrogenase [Paludibacter sp.]
MNYKIAFFDTKPYDEVSFNQINQKFGFEIKYFKGHLNINNVPLTKGFDAVCIFVNAVADAEVIDELAKNDVKVIALRCAGYNNVDLNAAKNRIKVVRVPAYSPYAVAEHTLALMLTLNRKTHKAYNRTREGNFALNGLMGFDMHGKTAGIIGTGKISKILIQTLRSMGLKVIAYDIFPDYAFAEKYEIEYSSLDHLYANADIISLHCPLTKDTEYIINETSIAKMKNGVMIINTGRGKLINTHALIQGLKSKKIGAAGLDVYEEESDYFFEDRSNRVMDDDILARLLSFNNVIVTSHQAFFTQEAMHNIAETTLQNIQDFIDEKPLVNEVTV